jgi:glycosyltransferase involved in cell wall biosynthesis
MHEHCRTVLMTTDAVGGVWRYSIELASELARMGVSTALAVLGPAPNHEQRQEAYRIAGLNLYECPCRLEWMDDPWDDVARSGEYLLALESEYLPDVVHLNGYAHAALPFRSPKLVVAHSCVLSWWQAVKREPAPSRYERYRRAVTAGLGAADEIVAPSAAMLRELQRFYGANTGNVIPNGISDVTPSRVRKEPFVLCAGRLWDEAKNVATLAAAARGLSIPVCVAGKGADQVTGVTPLGDLSAQGMRHWFERAAIYAAPAYYEPFGLAILEAATHGAALVLSNIETLREIWADAAIYVAPDDELALRSAIELLAHDPLLRQTMSERAQRRARNYPAQRQARRYQAVYRRIMRHHTAVDEPMRASNGLSTSPLIQGSEPCGL